MDAVVITASAVAGGWGAAGAAGGTLVKAGLGLDGRPGSGDSGSGAYEEEGMMLLLDAYCRVL